MFSEHADSVSGYWPTMSPSQRERIRAWHERAHLSADEQGAVERSFDYHDVRLVVSPGVMPITPGSHLLGDAVIAHVRPGDRVLDMGTGSGVNAVLAARGRGRVVAVDINPVAVETARANAARNEVAERVDARVSDVFSAVDGRFDVIVFDPPFRWFTPRDLAEAATTDEGYRAMTRFFRQARAHLTPTGTMLIFFGTSGDLAYLTGLMDETGFAAETIANGQVARDDATIEYFTFHVRQVASPAGC